MHYVPSVSILAIAAALAGCATSPPPADTSTAAAGTVASGTAAATPAAAPNSDPDQAANGAGVPPGYVGRTDDSTKALSGAKYTTGAGGVWEVQTGPAHILYSPKDSASGSYTLRTEIDQLEAPHHPEAYGIFFGGQNLTGPGQRYTYFIVRGNGMYAIKARDGATARTVVDFTANPAVPTADAGGKASYALTVRVAPDSVHFMVNEKPVAAVPTGSLAAAGVAGIRINHNLHVTVKPLVISR
jgi:hypothetical protein